jgi:hypothetical protein
MVLDSKESWSNLPYAILPAGVGLGLLVGPWLGVLSPSMTAPILVPFGLIWLVASFCIAGYHSEVILDASSGEVIYRSSLVLHSWQNSVARGNVKRVVLRKQESGYGFVMEVEEGEDLSVTTFDYWRSREWSEQVADFFGLPLVDECRQDADSEAVDIQRLAGQNNLTESFPEAPEGVRFERIGDRAATIWIPRRGLLPSSRPRLFIGTLSLLCGMMVLFLWPKWVLAGLIPGVVVIIWGWGKPLVQATHREEIRVSPHGVHATITSFGRVHRRSLALHQIREIAMVKGDDPRFLHIDFDRHAVCVEASHEHLQLGANLAQIEHVEWLMKVLVFFLTRGEVRAEQSKPQS